jgi:hypothetical protein
MILIINNSLGAGKDGQTITISDGNNTVVFEYDHGGGGVSGGNTQVVSAFAAPGFNLNFVEAIRQSSLKLSIVKLGLTDLDLKASYGVSATAVGVVLTSMTDSNITVTRSTTSGHFVNTTTVHETFLSEVAAINFPTASEIFGV